MDSRSRRYKENNEYIPCECGLCGGQLKKRYDLRGRENKMIRGHSLKLAPRSPVRWGKDSNTWKGGRKISYYGYVMLLRPWHYSADTNGYVFEHRYVYEKYYDCCLLSIADIHHKDHDKLNNDIKNLQPVWHSNHPRLHPKGKNGRQKRKW